MNYKTNVVIVGCVILLFISGVHAGSGFQNSIKGGGFASVPGPYLLYPVTDNIDLKGKELLEFSWERTDLARTQYFDFRLYEGYNTTEANLIFKEKYSLSQYPIGIPSPKFEVNQVYTWVLRQVFVNGIKSDKSFSSFKIIRK